MKLQDSIKSILQEEFSFLEMIRNLFSKKEITPDDKLVDLICKFIKKHYEISGHKVTRYSGSKEINFYWNNHKDVPLIMVYYPLLKKLEYNWMFTEDLHRWFGDDRLVHIDSELMGKIFEKLYNMKVNKCFGYNRL